MSKANRIVSAVILFGLIARLIVSWISFGSNDPSILFDYGAVTDAHGLAGSYRTLPELNNPPLAAYWAALVYSLTEPDRRTFAFVFLLPGILADTASCILLALIWQNRNPSARPW